MCLTPALGLEGCLGEQFLQWKTFFGGVWEATRDRYTPGWWHILRPASRKYVKTVLPRSFSSVHWGWTWPGGWSPRVWWDGGLLGDLGAIWFNLICPRSQGRLKEQTKVGLA